MFNYQHMTRNIRQEVFEVLRENLVAVRPDYNAKDIVLCPICLTEVSRKEVIKGGGFDHIVPQNVAKNDPPELTGVGTNCITKNQRCGVTVLCRRCNSLKGSQYDTHIGFWLNGANHEATPLSHRQWVAMLIMAYLGAFQNLGYEYILRPELDEIRRQFDYPDTTVTIWLSHIKIIPRIEGVFTTGNGLPFIMGFGMHEDSHLEMMFRKFWVVLPDISRSQTMFPKTLSTLRSS